jgi:hypothetical protein
MLAECSRARQRSIFDEWAGFRGVAPKQPADRKGHARCLSGNWEGEIQGLAPIPLVGKSWLDRIRGETASYFDSPPMAKLSRSVARGIVCDALSGALTQVPNQLQSEQLPVRKALEDLFKHDPDESISVYNYIRKRVKALGFPFRMLPDEIEMPNYETVGDLVTRVQITSMPEDDE